MSEPLYTVTITLHAGKVITLPRCVAETVGIFKKAMLTRGATAEASFDALTVLVRGSDIAALEIVPYVEPPPRPPVPPSVRGMGPSQRSHPIT